MAAVQLWDEVFPERNVEVFEGGAGNPLIFCIETDEVKSTLVTATLDIAASETLGPGSETEQDTLLKTGFPCSVPHPDFRPN